MENAWSKKVQHDITETANNIDLGMFLDTGKKISMNNDTNIQNDWYLKLDGKMIWRYVPVSANCRKSRCY
jgi:hypothetical protein